MDLRLSCFLVPLLLAAAAAQSVPAVQLPIRELTAFKDGHAFVLRSGDAPLPADGRIVLDDLPTPILGTFWPAVVKDGCALRGVTAGHRRVSLERTALDLRQLLAANTGARIVVREANDVRYEAVIRGLPARSAEEVAATARESGAVLPEHGDVVWLQTETTRRDTNAERIADAGLRLVRLDRIVDVTFVDPPKTRFADELVRPRLLLDVQCQGERPAAVPVSLGWVEMGFRWIPGYRVVLDGKGKASLRLQATLVNDLADLDGATVHLVVGVPSFAGVGVPDPISLQAAIARAAANMGQAQTANFFNNAIMSQVTGNAAQYSEPAAGAIGDLDAGRKEQDLFVFTLPGITLKKKDRMVVTLGETTVDYRDVWKLEVAIAPPQEAWNQLPGGTAELARLLAAPKVRHQIRLGNTGVAPFTTAPALVLQGEQVLAQGTMTYTPPGQTCDLDLTTAIDLLVEKTDRETGRTPNAVRWNGESFLQVDLEGRLVIANRRSEVVEVEIDRRIFGKLTAVGEGGAMEQLNVYDDDPTREVFLVTSRRQPWFASPWSLVMNGVGRARWKVRIEPGKEAAVTCAWHYFWR